MFQATTKTRNLAIRSNKPQVIEEHNSSLTIETSLMNTRHMASYCELSKSKPSTGRKSAMQNVALHWNCLNLHNSSICKYLIDCGKWWDLRFIGENISSGCYAHKTAIDFYTFKNSLCLSLFLNRICINTQRLFIYNWHGMRFDEDATAC